MSINEMSIKEVEQRMAELDKEIENMDTVEKVNAATEERKALLDRKAELDALETRKADALKLNAGTAQGVVIERKAQTNEREERAKKLKETGRFAF